MITVSSCIFFFFFFLCASLWIALFPPGKDGVATCGRDGVILPISFHGNAPREGEGGMEGRGGGGSLSRRRKQLEGVCGEVGAGMWLQLQTLKHEGKNWDRFFFFFFSTARGEIMVCVCVCVNKRYDGGKLDIKITLIIPFLRHTPSVFIIFRRNTWCMNITLMAVLYNGRLSPVYILSVLLMWLLRSPEDTATICTCECS